MFMSGTAINFINKTHHIRIAPVLPFNLLALVLAKISLGPQFTIASRPHYNNLAVRTLPTNILYTNWNSYRSKS